jgi:hypothetical protein
MARNPECDAAQATFARDLEPSMVYAGSSFAVNVKKRTRHEVWSA